MSASGEVGPAAVIGPALRDQLAANLARLDRSSEPLEGRRHAAVAVVVFDSADIDLVAEHSPSPDSAPPRLEWVSPPGGPAVLLTRRNAGLRAHAGQWALPGGRVDAGERPVDAARRELDEELGLSLPESALIGTLDDFPTRSGYVITPFVFWAEGHLTLTPHADEVLSVHPVPFAELRRADSPRFLTIPESDRPVVQILFGDSVIHAPTGAVLLQFRRVALEATIERVSGLEQPVFAWR
jgi:8-oxo-dGTP pyrophosphatase MutT (NUDIX family)